MTNPTKQALIDLRDKVKAGDIYPAVSRTCNPPPTIQKALNCEPITPSSCSDHCHVHEAFWIGGMELCLSCTRDAVERSTGRLQPWFFTGSPHGESILSALIAEDGA